MNEKQWNECADPKPMLEFLQGKFSDRKLKLTYAACWRRVWKFLVGPASERTVELLERLADGSVPKSEFNETLDAADEEWGDTQLESDEDFPGYVVTALAPETVSEPVVMAHALIKPLVAKGQWPELPSEPEMLSRIIRDVVGPLVFRDVAIESECLAWHDETPVKLARAAYEERSLPSGHLDNERLAVLADALEEAGCTTEEVLAHLRSPGPHYRGCWVVDLVLGKQ